MFRIMHRKLGGILECLQVARTTWSACFCCHMMRLCLQFIGCYCDIKNFGPHHTHCVDAACFYRRQTFCGLRSRCHCCSRLVDPRNHIVGERCTLAPHGEYAWMICVQRWCGLMSLIFTISYNCSDTKWTLKTAATVAYCLSLWISHKVHETTTFLLLTLPNVHWF